MLAEFPNRWPKQEPVHFGDQRLQRVELHPGVFVRCHGVQGLIRVIENESIELIAEFCILYSKAWLHFPFTLLNRWLGISKHPFFLTNLSADNPVLLVLFYSWWQWNPGKIKFHVSHQKWHRWEIMRGAETSFSVQCSWIFTLLYGFFASLCHWILQLDSFISQSLFLTASLWEERLVKPFCNTRIYYKFMI